MNNKHSFDEKQRFSLRKLTVGLASVLVGLTLFGTAQTANSQTVHASTITQDKDGHDVIGEEPAIDPSTGEPIQETDNVIYDAQDASQTIHYHTSDGQPAKDKDNKPVPDGQVTGKTDDMNKDVPMPNGYVPQTPGTDDKTNLTLDPNTGTVPDKTVIVKHGQHTTAPGETHNVGDQITPNPNDPNDAKVPGNTYQQAITAKDVKKDLTRTVTINKPKTDGNTTIADGKQHIDLDPETKSSTVSYHRTTTVDDVTGKVTGHGDWTLVDPSKHEFAGVTVPQFDGYTAHITEGENHELSSINPENAPTTNDGVKNYRNPDIVINYTANDQSVNYVFTDGAKGNVGSGIVHGVTGQTVDSKTALASVIKQLTDKGYDMSKVTIDPYKFKAQNGDITIDLANDHGIIKGVDPNPGGQDPNRPGDATKIPEGLKDIDGHKVVTLEDIRKDVTRTITAKEPTDADENARSDKDLSQHGVVTRTFDYDPVTKTVTHWNEWRPVSWSAVTVPEHAGYTATITNGEGHTLTSIDSVTTSDPSYKDPKIVITYKANSQSRNYVFKDGEKTVDQKAVNGVTDQTVDPATQLGDIKSDLENKGYDWSKIDLGGSYKFKASDNSDMTIDLSQAHGSKEVGHDGKIPDGVTDPNKSGNDKHVTDSDVTETVTRHITFHDPTHENSTSTQDRNADQTVTLKRGFTYDDVTKQVTSWGEWSTADVPAVDVPKVAGYQAKVTGAALTQDGKIAGDILKDGYKDPKISITYTANNQSRSYVFKDGEKTVDQKAVSGVTDQTVDPTNQLGDIMNDLKSKGYVLSKIDLGGSYKFKASDNSDMTIDLSQAHGSKEVGHDGKIPDGVTDPNKSGNDKHVTNSDVTETVTRHITFHDPTHENSTSTQDRNADQTVTLKRGFTYDTVTNEVTKYGDWTTQAVTAVDVPKVDGYEVAVTGAALTQDGKIAGDILKDGYKDPNITITYTANNQSRSYVFKDGEKTVDQKAVSGVTDQTVDPTNQLGDIMNDLKSKGYVLSKIDLGGSYKFEASGNDPKVIDLSHAHGSKEIGPDDTIPDGVTDPNKSGSDKHVTNSDVTETVTRHITFHDPTHENSTSTQDRNADQTVTLKRGFTYDTVTNEVTKYGDWTTQAVTAVDVPKVDGYEVAVTGAALTQDGKIAGDILKDGYKDPNITITYTAQDSTQTIHYVDENGHELSTTDNKDQNGNVIENSNVTVKTDEVGNVQVPKGWKLVDDHDQSTKVSYGNDGTIPVKNVKITHATVEVTPDTHHAKGDPIDPQVPTGSKYGAGLTRDDLNKIAYREIRFNLPASTSAKDYAQRLKDSGLSSAHVEEGTNNVVVRQEVAYKRTAIVDAITGEVKGYNPAGVKNQGWVPSGDKPVDAVIKNGGAVFNKVLIPQIAGYKAHTENAKATIMKLANGSYAALSRLFVSFMAIPAPKDGNSTGAVNKEHVKPDDTKPGKGDETKPGKGDETKPGKGDETKPGKGDETQPSKSDETQPSKGDDTKPGKGDDTKPGKSDDTKPGKSDDAKPGKGDDTKPGKGDAIQPGKGDDTKPGKGDDTKPGMTDDTKPGKSDDTKPGKSDDTKLGKSDGTKLGKGDETKPGKSDGTKPGKSDETKPGKSDGTKLGKGDETKPGKSDDTKPGKSDGTKPGKSDDAKPGKSDGTKPGKSDDAKPGKKAHVSPTSGANKKNSKITNAAVGVQAAKLNSNAPVGNANDEANKTSHTVQAAAVNSDNKALPQTGESQNKIGIIGAVFASLAGMLGLAGTKKKRKND